MAQENDKNSQNNEELKEQKKMAKNGELNAEELKEAAGGVGNPGWTGLARDRGFQ